MQQTHKLTGIALLKHIVDTWDPSDLNPVTVRFKDIWPAIDEYDALLAEVERLRCVLAEIAGSEPAACTHFDWNAEWLRLRRLARLALDDGHAK